MNKADLIDHLSQPLGSRRAATVAVEALVDVVIREVAAGGSVGITGFGTFERADRAPRTGRNPRTGDRVPIPGTSSPRFRPGTYFKNVVSEPEHLPGEGMAGGRAPVRALGATGSRSTKAEKKAAEKTNKNIADKGASAGSSPETKPLSQKEDKQKPVKTKSGERPSDTKASAKKGKASDKQPSGKKSSTKKSKSKKQSTKK